MASSSSGSKGDSDYHVAEFLVCAILEVEVLILTQLIELGAVSCSTRIGFVVGCHIGGPEVQQDASL